MNKFYLSIMALCAPALLWAQSRELTGKVVDEEGRPLAGVTIYVKQTGDGTTSTPAGTYRLKVKEVPAAVTFTFVGYTPRELSTADSKADFALVKMEPDVTNIHDVVVVGYGTQTKVNLTGAVDNVSVRDLETRPITQTSMALQGQVAGVDVVQNSGQPGDDYGTIRIRGVSSIENNNEPLVLIDGVEGDINRINPKDIASISVLKDASSASIYGSRAGAGVVLVTTKTGGGSSGKLSVSYNGSFSVQEPTTLPEPVKIMEYLDLREEMFLYNGEVRNFDQDRAKYASGEKVAVNYYLRHFRVAPMHDHHLGVSMGGRNYRSAVSLGYSDQDGVLRGTENRKMTFRANLDMYSSSRRFFTKFNVSGYRSEMTDLALGSSTAIMDIHRAGPQSIFQAYNGLYGYYGRHRAQLDAGGRILNTVNQLNAKVTMGVEPVKGLIVQGSFATVYYDSKRDQFVAPITTVGDLYGDTLNQQESSIDVRNSGTLSTTSELTATYKKRIRRHEINLLLGVSQYWWKNEWESTGRKNLSGNKPSLNFGDPATVYNSSEVSKRTSRSLFARAGYSYDDRYLFEFNIRRDGSSRFVNKKWGTFPSVSAGWRISEESFFKHSALTHAIDNLKLRVSWGRLGNEYIASNYTGYAVLSYGNYYDFGGTMVGGAAITELSNPDTTWETSEMTNIGLDLSLLRQLTLTVDLFYKRTTGVLMKKPVAPSLIGNVNGGTFQNAGSMENKGLELTLAWRRTFRNKLSLNATFITSFVRNKILDVGETPIIAPNGLPFINRNGSPTGAFYGYRMEGIYQFEDFTWQNGSDPNVPLDQREYKLKPELPVPSEGTPRPGDLKFADLSGPDGKKDGKIDLAYDRTVIGNPFPDVTLSFNAGLEWKGIDFNMFWQASLGRDMYNQGSMVIPFYSDTGNVWRYMADRRWTADNPTDRYPRLNYDAKTVSTRSSYYIFDGSYLRLKNIELGYTFPARWTSAIRISKLRVYAGIQNAWTLTKFPGWDPERPSTNISSEIYPQVRIYNFGLNVTF